MRCELCSLPLVISGASDHRLAVRNQIKEVALKLKQNLEETDYPMMNDKDRKVK